MTLIVGESGWDTLLPALQAEALTAEQRSRLALAHQKFSSQIQNTIHPIYRDPVAGITAKYGGDFVVSADGAEATYPPSLSSFLRSLGHTLNPVVTSNAIQLDTSAIVVLVGELHRLDADAIVFATVLLEMEADSLVVTSSNILVEVEASTFVLLRNDLVLASSVAVVARKQAVGAVTLYVAAQLTQAALASAATALRYSVVGDLSARVVNDPEPEQWNISVSADDADVLLIEDGTTLTTDG